MYGELAVWNIFQYTGKYFTLLAHYTDTVLPYIGHCQYSTVQYITVQYSTVQYSTVQYSTVQENNCLAGAWLPQAATDNGKLPKAEGAVSKAAEETETMGARLVSGVRREVSVLIGRRGVGSEEWVVSSKEWAVRSEQ